MHSTALGHECSYIGAISTMTSLTPLHETYCKWDSTPLSQADLLEGLAQLFSKGLGDVVEDLLLVIQREILFSVLGIHEDRAKKFQKFSFIEKIYHFGYSTLQQYSRHLLAPTLRQLLNRFPNLHHKPLTPALHFLVGMLNGVLGDYLLKHQNPLALPTTLYDHYGELQQGDLSGKIVIFVHGLCMNHLDWSNRRQGGIGEKLLAQRAHHTMLYLNYNSGRRISANGRSLANLVEDLLQRNPQITGIDFIGHSMGGLVARSALFYGKQQLHAWVHATENLVCIGSPHHGAALERFGFNIQSKLGNFPIVRIFAHVVSLRSNGILDLRHGSVRDDDWEHNEMRLGHMDDQRKPAPLPAHINTFLVAGTLQPEDKQHRALQIIGDYLVSVPSALGEHPNLRFHLKVPQSHKAVFYGLNHFEIQYHPHVAEQIAEWLYDQQQDQQPNVLHEYQCA